MSIAELLKADEGKTLGFKQGVSKIRNPVIAQVFRELKLNRTVGLRGSRSRIWSSWACGYASFSLWQRSWKLLLKGQEASRRNGPSHGPRHNWRPEWSCCSKERNLGRRNWRESSDTRPYRVN
jgi:hypothetical protein